MDRTARISERIPNYDRGVFINNFLREGFRIKKTGEDKDV